MSQHLSSRDLELYVVDGLGAARAGEIEAHVVGCNMCGAALTREAALEMAFEQIARAPASAARSVKNAHRLTLTEYSGRAATPRGQNHHRPGRLGFAVLTGTLSLAAAWMLFSVPVTHRTQAASFPYRSAEPTARAGAASDAMAVAFDGSSPDRLDGG